MSIAALLLRYTPAPQDTAAIELLAAEAVARHPGQLACVDANRALDGSALYLYFWFAEGTEDRTPVVAALAELARLRLPGTDPAVLELASVQDLPGASSGQAAPYHYVVETDLRPDAATELDNWYRQEHLPGLAAVEGNVRARRLVAHSAGGLPRSVACYELTTPDVKTHPAWLAVRATEWSGRVRPCFQNSLRVMCERIHTLEPGKGQS
ncbi:hypothetical protein PIGHUM_03808 [Pigmentiphaga humi]|uniref:NIPSNAP domain-containing protein n=1 Tax=Pigmentiphaga humi TaxID=2478468 RepID=A0A3P4B7X4_9BURK|nr:hypothetical protein [Pigmentiphaga humi]VCU71720.1 hypothetical protein PIGHUM_03808 [Pigmentiphaga humi]